MYKHYYVNKVTTNNPNNNHEVHSEECAWFPSVSNRDYLGHFDNCAKAVEKASSLYSNIDGCAICCPDCHKG